MDDLIKAARVPDEGDTHTSLTAPHLTDSANGFYWSLFYSNGHSHLSWQHFKEEMIKQPLSENLCTQLPREWAALRVINKKHDKYPRHRRHDKRKDKLAKLSAITIPPATKMPID